MHSGVIEGGGFMGMDQLEVDGKILGCIFFGDLDRIQYADFNPVYAPWNPGTLENTAATSPYPQRPRIASISLPPAETNPCAHFPSIVSECTSTAPAIKLCFLSLFIV